MGQGLRLSIWGFLVAIAYWPGILSAAFVPRWAVVAIGVALVGKIDPRALTRPILWLLVAALTAAALSVLQSPDRRGGLLELFYFVAFAGVFVVSSGFQSITPALRGLCAGLVLSSVLCLWQLSGWSVVPQASVPAGLFFSREVLAEFAAPLLVWAIVRREWLCILAAIVPVALCDSRVAFASVAVGLLAAWRVPWQTKCLTLVPIALAAVAMLFVFGAEKFSTGGLRMVLWGATAMAIRPWPQGLGWFLAVHPNEQFAHSDLLQVLAEFGVIGALPLLAIFVLMLKYGNGERGERAAFVAISVEAIVSFPLHVPATGFLAFLLAGHLARRRIGVCDHEYGGRIDAGADLLRSPDNGIGNHAAGRSGRRAFSL